MKRFVTVTVAACFVSACSNVVPSENLVEVEHFVPKPTYNDTELPAAIGKARVQVQTDLDHYSSTAGDKRNVQTAFDTSVILLAAGTVVAAFYGATSDLVGGLGLAGTTTTSLRGYYDPEGEGAAALKAKSALACVMDRSEVLTRADPGALNVLLWKLDDEINSARIAQSLVSGANAKDAAEATNKAIEAAAAAKTAIQTELAAIREAPETISDSDRQAVQYVDSKFHRASPSLQDISQTVSQGIDFATTGATNVANARTKLESAMKATAQQQGATGDTRQASPSQLGDAALKTRDSSNPLALMSTKLAPAPTEVQLKPESKSSAAAAEDQNVEYASSLVSLTQQALDEIPQPAYSAVDAKINGCVAGM